MSHPRAKEVVTLTVTQEELAVLTMGLERMCDIEDGEYVKIRSIAEETNLPPCVLTYADMKA